VRTSMSASVAASHVTKLVRDECSFDGTKAVVEEKEKSAKAVDKTASLMVPVFVVLAKGKIVRKRTVRFLLWDAEGGGPAIVGEKLLLSPHVSRKGEPAVKTAGRFREEANSDLTF
jgi:hypothetical protein